MPDNIEFKGSGRVLQGVAFYLYAAASDMLKQGLTQTGRQCH